MKTNIHLIMFACLLWLVPSSRAETTILDSSCNPGSGANGLVETVLPVPGGKILVCGNFTVINGVQQPYIARLNANGSVDMTFSAHPGYWVRHMALQSDGKIVIGGFFTSVDGQPRNLIARLNANGGLDTGFDPGTGARGTLGVSITGNPDPFVFQLALQTDGKILITGNFTNYNGTAVSGLARLTPAGALDTTFEMGSGLDTWGRSIQVLGNGQILVSGWFNNYHNQSHNKMVLINPNGSPDTGFNPFFGDMTAVYTAVRLADGKYIVGGHSLNPQGLFHQEMARLNADGSVDSTFTAYANDKIQSLKVQGDGKILLGGEFTQINGQPKRSIARLNPDGSLDTAFGANVDNYIWTVALPGDGKILVSGGFTQIDGISRNGVARLLSSNTGTPPPTDRTGPLVRITAPSPDLVRVLNNSITLTGTASDPSGISSLNVSLDRGSVGSVQGTTSWSAVLNLAPGSNTVTITAADTANNVTVVNRRFIYVVTSPLTVTINGSGTFSPNLNGAVLEVGRSYTLTAHPQDGFIFNNWSGGLSASTPTIRLLMEQGLTLQANFLPNPFRPLTGTYNGLFYNPDAPANGNAGSVILTLTGSGAYSGRLVLMGVNYPFTGEFNASLQSQKTISRERLSPLQLNLQLQGNDKIQGTVSDGSFVASLTAYRAVFAGNNRGTNFNGRYTIVLPGGANRFPAGHGYMTLAINPSGNVILGGSLADGTIINRSSRIAANGYVPIYQTYNGGQAVLFGWLVINPADTTDLQGSLRWERAAGGAGGFAAGFTNQIQVLGSRYLPPAPGTRVLNLVNSPVILFDNGDLSPGFSQSFELDTRNHFALRAPNAAKVNLNLNPASGVLNGTFVNPTTHRPTEFRGVVLQKQNYGGGFFPGSGISGSVFVGETDGPRIPTN